MQLSRRDHRDPAMHSAAAAAADSIERGFFPKLAAAPKPSRTFEIVTDDGVLLAVDAFLPRGPAVAKLLLAPAMGVKRRFYGRFLAELAEHGIASIVLDYRGIGDSRHASIRDERASLSDWGERDLVAATRALQRLDVTTASAEVPLLFFGHSVGGQLFGLMKDAPFSAAYLVASQAGYWKHWEGAGRLAMAALWFGAIPLFSSTVGYLPMRAFGQGEDIPDGVAREWATWGRDPSYVGVRASQIEGSGYATWSGPLRAVSIADDGYAPERAIHALVGLYRRAEGDVARVLPREVGARQVGHFGWFSPRHRSTLWASARDWLFEKGGVAR
jgi:predicted alpha/beta hydrolase